MKQRRGPGAGALNRRPFSICCGEIFESSCSLSLAPPSGRAPPPPAAARRRGLRRVPLDLVAARRGRQGRRGRRERPGALRSRRGGGGGLSETRAAALAAADDLERDLELELPRSSFSLLPNDGVAHALSQSLYSTLPLCQTHRSHSDRSHRRHDGLLLPRPVPRGRPLRLSDPSGPGSRQQRHPPGKQ